MRVYLPRFHVGDFESNLAALRRDAAEAAGLDCQLVVFPEQFLTGYHGAHDLEAIRAAFQSVSADHPAPLFVFGTISEDGVSRQYLYSRGRPVAHYDKVHLFLPNGEGEWWRPGERYVAVEHGEWRIGLATCNDVRFPEQARALTMQLDVNLLVYPALWPWSRDSIWAALLKARAIENGCFVVGCCVAGVDNGVERFDGAGNHVFDPLGDELHPEQRVYVLETQRLGEVLVNTRREYRAVERVELVRCED